MRRLLVANRGEIARRVLRAAASLGIETVAVFADDDRSSPHVAEADRAVLLGAGPAADTYLDLEKVLAAAALHRRRRPPPRLRLPVRGPAAGRGVRGGRHHLGGTAAGRHGGHGPQGPGQGHRGRGRGAGAAGGGGRRRRPRSPGAAGRRGRLPPPGEGLGRWGRPGHAAGRGPRRAGRGGRRRPPGGRRLVRVRRGVLRALPPLAPPRRGAGGGGPPRQRAPPLRPRVLDPAAPPEGGRGGPGLARAPTPCAGEMWAAAVAAARAVGYEGVGTVEFVVGGSGDGEAAPSSWR